MENKPKSGAEKEIENIRERYDKRNAVADLRYSILNPSVYMAEQEKERALIRWIQFAGIDPQADKKLLEVGCGSGVNLIKLIQLGFKPENLVGNELLDERAAMARRKLPGETQIMIGDAATLDLGDHSFDVVFQSTVFTSILNEDFQKRLADRMWSWVKPGGGVLWYDFTYNNPRNMDVKGVPVVRIRQLFPEGEMKVWRVTLAPPISRLVTRIHPGFYTLFNYWPFLRSHVLCWIKKS